MCIFVIGMIKIAKDCLLTGQEQAGSRITKLVVCSVGCHCAENGLIHWKMVDVEYPKVNLFSRPHQGRRIIGQASLLHMKLDTGSCF